MRAYTHASRNNIAGTRNRRTLFICGTDEYGTATETQAIKEGMEPKALCDKYYELHKETYKWFELACALIRPVSAFLRLTVAMADSTTLEGHQDRSIQSTLFELSPKHLSHLCLHPQN